MAGLRRTLMHTGAKPRRINNEGQPGLTAQPPPCIRRKVDNRPGRLL